MIRACRFEPSSDPLLETARSFVASYRLGSIPEDLSGLDPLLADSKIWGVDLIETGLADLVKDYSVSLAPVPEQLKTPCRNI